MKIVLRYRRLTKPRGDREHLERPGDVERLYARKREDQKYAPSLDRALSPKRPATLPPNFR